MHLNPDCGTSEFILIWPKVCATVHNTSRNSHQDDAIGSDYGTLHIQETLCIAACKQRKSVTGGVVLYNNPAGLDYRYQW